MKRLCCAPDAGRLLKINYGRVPGGRLNPFTKYPTLPSTFIAKRCFKTVGTENYFRIKIGLIFLLFFS